MRKVRGVSVVSWVLLLAFALFATHASAGIYPSNECASEKIEAAANRCDQVLKAWSVWAKTQRDPQRRIDQADRAFDAKWTSAEAAAAQENVDCAEMTLSGADMKTLMDAAIDDILAEIIPRGPILGGPIRSHPFLGMRTANCASKQIQSAATLCQKRLRAESRYIDDPSRDLDGVRRDAMQAKASSRFSRKWDGVTGGACVTGGIEGEIADRVDALSDAVVTHTTVSPNVPDDAFIAISHPLVGEPGHEVAYQGDVLGPRCQDSSQYSFFARRGTENKLLMYYEGGGACWESLTCGAEMCKQDVDLGDYTDLTTPGGGFGPRPAVASGPDLPISPTRTTPSGTGISSTSPTAAVTFTGAMPQSIIRR